MSSNTYYQHLFATYRIPRIIILHQEFERTRITITRQRTSRVERTMQARLLLKELPKQSHVNSVQNSLAKCQFAISRVVERMLRSV